MSTRVADRVDGWDQSTFEGGYRALHELADREFSGVIKAGGGELYMARGVAVGLLRGALEDFEDSSGTVYEAPADALPLLAIMQERADEKRAQYYSEKTAISEVDGTLSDGGFTGFIELSENVLSGDYYLVYHAGISMSVAFVGESAQRLDGDEAFERANDEVGIYQVYQVDIEPVELPAPSEPAPETTPGGQADGDVSESDSDSADGRETETTKEEESAGDEPTPEAKQDEEEIDTADSPDSSTTAVEATETTTKQSTEAAETGSEERGRESTETTAETTATGVTTDSSSAEQAEGKERIGTVDRETEPTVEADHERRDPEPSGQANAQRGRTGKQTDSSRTASGAESGRQPGAVQTGSNRSQTSTETASLEQRAIPSLDPARTMDIDRRTDTQTEPAHRSQPAGDGRSREPETEVESNAERTESAGTTTEGNGSGEETTAESEPTPTVDTERVEELEAELEEREVEIQQRESELERTTEERDELEDQLETLRSERDELRERVETLENQLEQLETELGAATDAQQRMTAGEALSGTDLFVRYHSKGDATLEKAHGSGVRKDDVDGNLNLETHTTFDKDTVAVGGQTFDEFLANTVEYQFVNWVVRELLFEIRSTGHENELKDLYNALPDIDRAELSGVVEVVYSEGGQETRTQETFDVVLRDRMGNPLLVANLNDSRQAATESMMEQLITSAERVGQSSDDFSAAFLVTQSFFEPGALETTSEATQGGLLSRSKRKSFVNISRKRGYHLCLVEARNQNFHVTVPEL